MVLKERCTGGGKGAMVGGREGMCVSVAHEQVSAWIHTYLIRVALASVFPARCA